MGKGISTLIWGILFVIGGASGSFVLKGTGSSGALVLVGFVAVVIGIVQLGAAGNEDSYVQSEQERDEEQFAEYERAKKANAKKNVTLAKKMELERLVGDSPALKKEIDEVLERVRGHLDEDQQLTLALETAKRITAEHINRPLVAGSSLT